MSNKQLRDLLRILHLITGIIIGVYIYSPWGTDPTFRMAVQFVVVPLVGLTGIAMWQQARLNKLLKGRS